MVGWWRKRADCGNELTNDVGRREEVEEGKQSWGRVGRAGVVVRVLEPVVADFSSAVNERAAPMVS